MNQYDYTVRVSIYQLLYAYISIYSLMPINLLTTCLSIFKLLILHTFSIKHSILIIKPCFKLYSFISNPLSCNTPTNNSY